MSFGYTRQTISGSLANIEGVTKGIQSIGSFMQNTLGWQLVEDLTVTGTTKQLVLKSNGEDLTASTFYFVMTSGTDNIGLQIATAWDTNTHTIPGSGAISPTAPSTVTLTIRGEANYAYWVSGDKDSVVLLTRANGRYDGSYMGRIRQITDKTQDPFPIYLTGDSTQNVDSMYGTSNNYSFLNGTTAFANSGNTDFESLFTGIFGVDQAPQNIFGSGEGYVCTPLVAGVSTSTQRSVRGFSMNMWTTIGPNAVTTISLTQEDIFDPGLGRTYQAFFDSTNSSAAVVIRRS